MTDITFAELNLGEQIGRAVEELGFDTATPIQAEAIPVIRTGVDVIARSQTGTGKTLAFAIPALEIIEGEEHKPTIQALILCPTRELAQQAGEEIRKLAKFLPGVRPVEVYGGADMERQFIKLRRANLVIGTPGRVMDHMRRKTIKLENLKMIVLDEADEMLKMGFKEDIETILRDTPGDRQTILFSATMPPAILSIASQFQHDPAMIEINKSQVTIENIAQSFVDVPTAQKTEALELLLRYHRPVRSIIFCNTKRAVDELCETLGRKGFAVEGLHGDMKQFQRTAVMNAFKGGRVTILIATDVAARGIDVNDIDYVINYDIPLKTEYYVHRIGRTGRAGKSGCSITICCGKRQTGLMRGIAREVKSEIVQVQLPTGADILALERADRLARLETAAGAEIPEDCHKMVAELAALGHTPETLAAALLHLHFPATDALPHVTGGKTYSPKAEMGGSADKTKRHSATAYADILIDIGSESRVAPNHLVGAITERSGISGTEIGKITIYADQSVVGIPVGRVAEVMEAMRGCKICGKPTRTVRMAEESGHRKAAPYQAPKAPRFPAKRKSADPLRKRKHWDGE